MRISDWSSDVCSSDLADPWCWFAPPPLAPIDRFSKGTVWESLEPRAIIQSAPVLLELALEHLARNDRLQIGRASCRDRVGQYVKNAVGGVSLKKKKQKEIKYKYTKKAKEQKRQ